MKLQSILHNHQSEPGNSYGAVILLELQRLCIAAIPFEKGPKLLRRVSNVQDYNKMQSFFPAAVILSTKDRVCQGDITMIQKLWDSKDKTFLAVSFEWSERNASSCLEFGYSAARCSHLDASVQCQLIHQLMFSEALSFLAGSVSGLLIRKSTTG